MPSAQQLELEMGLRVDAIFFDLDGTLVDSSVTWRRSVAAVRQVDLSDRDGSRTLQKQLTLTPPPP